MHLLHKMEELMPSLGSSIPSPAILSVVLCQSESAFQNVGRLCTDSSFTSSIVDSSPSLNLPGRMGCGARTTLISISDDGKIWNWLLTSEKARNVGLNSVAGVGEGSLLDTHSGTTSNYSTMDLSNNVKESEHTNSTNALRAGITDSIFSTQVNC